jgi:hypothetical protein
MKSNSVSSIECERRYATVSSRTNHVSIEKIEAGGLMFPGEGNEHQGGGDAAAVSGIQSGAMAVSALGMTHGNAARHDQTQASG